MMVGTRCAKPGALTPPRKPPLAHSSAPLRSRRTYRAPVVVGVQESPVTPDDAALLDDGRASTGRAGATDSSTSARARASPPRAPTPGNPRAPALRLRRRPSRAVGSPRGEASASQRPALQRATGLPHGMRGRSPGSVAETSAASASTPSSSSPSPRSSAPRHFRPTPPPTRPRWPGTPGRARGADPHRRWHRGHPDRRPDGYSVAEASAALDSTQNTSSRRPSRRWPPS